MVKLQKLMTEMINMKLTGNDIVLFSGDSITEGNRVLRMDCNHVMGHGYQYIVAAELALRYSAEQPKFVNKGYSGYSMPQILEKWQEDVIDNKPTVLSILAGVNDGHQGCMSGKTVAEVAETYSKSLDTAIKSAKDNLPGIRVMVLEPFFFPLDRSDLTYRYTPNLECEGDFTRPDTNDTEEQIAYRVEAIHLIRRAAKEIAEANGAVFVPLYDIFKEEIAKSRPEYFIWDGTHPTITGHALIAREWLKAFLSNP